MPPRGHRPILASLVALLISTVARADAIVVVRAMKATTIVEAFLDESNLRLEIEMGIADAMAFVNILPQEFYDELDLPPASLAERQERFVREDLVITADGQVLPGRLASAEIRPRLERDEISGEPLPVAEEDVEPVIHFVLEYPLDGQPASISFKVPDVAAPGATANIGFVFYHLGVAANDFRYLTSGATIDLDWNDPWHSRFRARTLRRTYDAPMNVFLYIEPYEVRVEVIMRPLDAQTWVDLGLERRGTITPEMYGAVQDGVADLLATHMRLTIDGEPVEPVLDRINFLRRTLRRSTVIDPPEALSVFTAQLGAIFVVPRDGLPREAEITWDLFSPKIPSVPGAATDEAGPMPFFLTADDNVLRWQNFLLHPTIPTMVEVETPPPSFTRLLGVTAATGLLGFVVVAFWVGIGFARTRSLPRMPILLAVVLAAGGVASIYGRRQARLDDTRTGTVVGALLHNVYRSFDFRQEDVIYDALARSLSGDLLTQAYLEINRSLELRNQGGARVKVTDVEIVECRPERLRGGGFTAECRWSVTGSVGHWGHIHQRRNLYDAHLTVQAVNGRWKITEMELLAEERL